MQNTTLTNVNLYEEMENPFTGEKTLILTSRKLALEEQREQVRLRLVEAFSSAPLYQARAEKDPEYWNTFYLGQVR